MWQKFLKFSITSQITAKIFSNSVVCMCVHEREGRGRKALQTYAQLLQVNEILTNMYTCMPNFYSCQKLRIRFVIFGINKGNKFICFNLVNLKPFFSKMCVMFSTQLNKELFNRMKNLVFQKLLCLFNDSFLYMIIHLFSIRITILKRNQSDAN